MNRLKELRQNAGLSQAELAKATDTTQRNISYWESGKIELNLYAAIRLAQLFQVDIEYLAGYTDDLGIKPDSNLPYNFSNSTKRAAPTAGVMHDSIGLTEKEKALLKAFKNLLPETQDFILRTAQSLSDKNSAKTLTKN